MSFPTDAIIIYNGDSFYGAKELGFSASGSFILSLYPLPATHEHRGGYWTSIPISGKEYRREHPTKTAFEDHGHMLVIYSDWGTPDTIRAPREILDMLVAECLANEIPQKEVA